MILNEWINYKSTHVFMGTYQDYLLNLNDFLATYYFALINETVNN